MAIKVRERSLSKISNILGLNFASSAYKAFRSIGTNHQRNQIMIFLTHSAGSVAANCLSSSCKS